MHAGVRGPCMPCQPSEHDQSYMQAVREGHLAAADAVDLLSSEYFFTSPKLATLATEAEILAKVLPSSSILINIVIKEKTKSIRSWMLPQDVLYRPTGPQTCCAF